MQTEGRSSEKIRNWYRQGTNSLRVRARAEGGNPSLNSSFQMGTASVEESCSSGLGSSCKYQQQPALVQTIINPKATLCRLWKAGLFPSSVKTPRNL